MYLVSWCAWSAGTPWISTRTRGSMMAPSLLLATLGSCCPLITCAEGTCRMALSPTGTGRAPAHSCSSPASLLSPYLDCQGDGAGALPGARITRVEESSFISHEGWFKHVATVAILAEQPITQVHLHASCLEVQGHWGKVARNWFSIAQGNLETPCLAL